MSKRSMVLAWLALCLFCTTTLTAQDKPPEKEPDKTVAPSKTEKTLLSMGYSPDELLDSMRLNTAAAQARALAQVYTDQADAIVAVAAKQAGAYEVIEDRLRNTRRMRSRDKKRLVISLSQRMARRASLLATQSAYNQSATLLDQESTLLSTQLNELRIRSEKDAAKEKEEQLRKQREAEQKKLTAMAKKKAAAEANQARRDLEDAKKLSSAIEKVQRDRLDSAERIEVLTDLIPKTQVKQKEFFKTTKVFHATLNEELRLLIKRTELPVKPKRAKEEVDPKFEAMRKAFRDAMDLYRQSTNAIQGLIKERETFGKILDRLKEEQDSLKGQDKDIAQSKLLLARQKSLETQVRRYGLELQFIKMKLAHHEALKKLAQEQIDQDKVFTEQLLPRLSDTKRTAFFDLTSDQNWQDARMAAKLGFELIIDHATGRLVQLFALPSAMMTVKFWSWVLGLLLRLGAIVLLLRFVKKNATKYTKKLTDVLLRQRIFARRPSVAIKIGEIIRHVITPSLRLTSIWVIITYVQPILPEARWVFLVVKAIFIFQITTIIVSVLVLPRALRANKQEEDFYDIDQWDEQEDGADVFSIEIDRAKKLVRSAKVIIWFWLLVLYLPMLVVAFMGHSVIWRVVDLASMWFLVIVIYSVLTTWKNDIARLFERLAAERLPRGVQFVNSNKDRIWGVLVIGLASVYVIGRESARLGREYLLEREWSKRINNFIFRKKIEIQQREQAKREGDIDYSKMLPERYTSHFHTDRCLWDEPYMVERTVYLDEIIKIFETHSVRHKQGSVALIGETGIGKTTLLNQLDERMRELNDGREEDVMYLTIFTKMTGRPGVFRLLRRLFQLGPDIQTKAQLIRAIKRKSRKVIIVDDCHHLFLRQIGGFAGLELFLEVVNLTDTYHIWVLSFNRFAWYYLARVRRREHYFGKILPIAPWSEAEVQDLVSRRNLMAGTQCSFSDLVVAHEPAEADAFSYEVIKSANGYFRLLHEFSQGNPRVAMTYWLRSLKPIERVVEEGAEAGDDAQEDALQVSLFRRPEQRVSQTLPDNYWFALTAIAQHGSLSATEMAGVINADLSFCETAINFFEETDVISVDSRYRARLRPLYFRQVLKYMVDSNYLYE